MLSITTLRRASFPRLPSRARVTRCAVRTGLWATGLAACWDVFVEAMATIFGR